MKTEIDVHTKVALAMCISYMLLTILILTVFIGFKMMDHDRERNSMTIEAGINKSDIPREINNNTLNKSKEEQYLIVAALENLTNRFKQLS